MLSAALPMLVAFLSINGLLTLFLGFFRYITSGGDARLILHARGKILNAIGWIVGSILIFAGADFVATTLSLSPDSDGGFLAGAMAAILLNVVAAAWPATSPILRLAMRWTVQLGALPLPVDERADFAESTLAMLFRCGRWDRWRNMSSIVVNGPLMAAKRRRARSRLQRAVVEEIRNIEQAT